MSRKLTEHKIFAKKMRKRDLMFPANPFIDEVNHKTNLYFKQIKNDPEKVEEIKNFMLGNHEDYWKELDEFLEKRLENPDKIT
jgi:hypothetical protein